MSERMGRLGAIVSALRDSRTTRKKLTERPAFEQSGNERSHRSVSGGAQRRAPARIPSQPRQRKVVRRLTPEDAVKGYKKRK